MIFKLLFSYIFFIIFIKQYCIFQSEIYEVDDTYNYDDATLTKHHDIWNYSIDCLERHDEYSTVSDVNGTDGLINTVIPSNAIIELDYMVDVSIYAWCIEIGVTGWALGNCYSSARLNTWYHVKIEVGTSSSTMSLYDINTGELLGSSTKTHTSTASRLYLRSRDVNVSCKFKNVRIYNA